MQRSSLVEICDAFNFAIRAAINAAVWHSLVGTTWPSIVFVSSGCPFLGQKYCDNFLMSKSTRRLRESGGTRASVGALVTNPEPEQCAFLSHQFIRSWRTSSRSSDSSVREAQHGEPHHVKA